MAAEEQIVLERLGPTKQEVVIDKDFFYCGRMKENQLVCLSLLVSREHCVFTKIGSELYVTDLGSSNGVYVNQVAIRKRKEALLKVNDYVGIGCPGLDNLDDSMFVYQVKRKVIPQNNCDSNTNDLQESARLARKQQSRLRQSEINSIPNKIAKIEKDESDDDIIEIIPGTSNATNENDVKQKESGIVSDIIDISDSEEVVQKNSEIKPIDSSAIGCTEKIPKQIIENEKMAVDSASISNVSSNNENVNIKFERQSEDLNDPLASIKQEPDWSHFSQIDIVEINDDDNSIFTYSQNFEKVNVKQEPGDNDNENDMCHSSLFLEDDDENVITILDSDDEGINDFTKYSNSVPNIKVEPGLEFVDVAKSSDTVEAMQTDEPSNNIDISNHEGINSIASESVNETSQVSEKQLSSHKNNKSERKGPEIVEPHHLQVNKKSKTTEKKSESKSEHKRKLNKEKVNSSKSSLEKHKDRKSSKNRTHKKHDESNCSETKSHKTSKNEKSHSSKSCSEELKNKKSNNTEASTKKISKESKSKKSDNENKLNNVSGSNQSTSDISNNNNHSNSDEHNESRPKYKTTKVKVKVSQKSRGDMLCDSMLSLRPKPKKSQKPLPKKPTTVMPVPTSFGISRPLVPLSSKSTSTSGSSEVTAQSDMLSSDKENTPTVCDENVNPACSPPSDRNNILSSAPSPEPVNNDVLEPPTTSSVLKSNLTVSSLFNATRKNDKHVKFNDNPSVREYPIPDGNNLRNVKDGLSLRSTKKDFVYYKAMDLKIEDFLARVFAWEPIWLQQQEEVKSLPPIVKKEDMQPLPDVFNSFQQYYKRMETLLLLETWQQLVKEFKYTGMRYNTSVVLPCTIVRHSINQMQTPNGLRYSTLALNTAVSRHQLQLNNQPVYGDVIILEYPIKQGNERKIRRAFAYVIEVQQHNSQRSLRINENLRRVVSRPDAVFTYIVQTRIIDEHTVVFDEISKMRSLLYMRSHLRLIQAIQYVPHSALRDSILEVNIDGFQMKPVSLDDIYKYKLVTQEKLNEKQLEAVIKFTNASINLEPKIGLLVGPPGTGKSKVIANLVTEMLYGNGRYVNGKKLRILVCAPSNAAIDEIVLRLLDIRSAIKDHRFRMVRIGRMESMHEEVKKISLVELSKREAQKSMAEHQHKHLENIESKKHQLKHEIEALQTLVANNPYKEMYRKDLEHYRAVYQKLTNRSPEEDAAELSKIQNNAKTVILQKADVITCTLTSCYTGQMESIFGGDSGDKIGTCIVDEATQCCEAETLIPLLLGVKSLILVGDPNQLPATVMSPEAKKLGLDKSLFTRTKQALTPQCNNQREDTKDPVITLNIQYRMVNAISHWPNNYFYGGKLIDSVNYKQNFPFQPYRVLNIDGIQDDIKFSNTSEAIFVGNLINCLMVWSKWNSEKKITIGVITPYQNQKSLILSTIKEQIKNVPDNIKNKFVTEVNTIDSFQGQERDVIIMSCVRSSGIGFMSDQQRLCVALTRAKYTLIICGNFTTFKRDQMWNDLLRDARSRGIVVPMSATAKPNEIRPHVIKSIPK